MAQKKKSKSSRSVKSQTQKSQPQTVNEDLRSQQILAQTVVDTVTAQQERIKELESQAAKTREENTRLAAELTVKSKNVETAPQVSADPNEASLAYAKYLKEKVLPQARQGSFRGTGMVMKNGKLEEREITNVAQLEALIEELESGAAQTAVGTVGSTGQSSSGFMSKLKKLVGG